MLSRQRRLLSKIQSTRFAVGNEAQGMILRKISTKRQTGTRMLAGIPHARQKSALVRRRSDVMFRAKRGNGLKIGSRRRSLVAGQWWTLGYLVQYRPKGGGISAAGAGAKVCLGIQSRDYFHHRTS